MKRATMRTVLRRPVQQFAGCMLAVALAGCAILSGPGSGSPGQSPGGLTVKLLSDYRPLSVGPPNIVVARSVPELKALLHGPRDVRFHEPDGWDAFAGRQGQVFIALARGFCSRITTVSATRDSNGVVQVDYKIEGQCAPGAGSAAVPGLYLASIPVGQLGSGVSTFHLGYGRARVDLRQPIADWAPANVAREALQAVAAVRRAVIQPSFAPVRELDLMRWPDSTLGCDAIAASPASLPLVGYIVVVDRGNGETPRPEEFHFSGGRVVDCGPAAGRTHLTLTL